MPTGDDAPRDERLLSAAEAVAEGRPVDWGEASERLPELSGPIAELRALERLAAACRDGAVRADHAAEPMFRWGHLEAVEKLGEGGFGEVWRAWDPALQRDVALKLERAGGAARPRPSFEEARRLARVRHPNVVGIHGMDVRDDRAGLWMERIDGVTLEHELAARGPMGASEAAGVGLDLCRALAAVHAAGLVHGDLKPANVMRERGGRIVLMDFGSGHGAGAGPFAAPVTGTPLATAPEVLGGGASDPRSDVWSLGALLFRLLTARWPVEADSLDALRARHARGDRLALRAARPDLPMALVETVERALANDPRERFADVAGMERALAGALAAAPSPFPPRAASTRTPLVLAGVLVAVAVTAAWWSMRAPRERSARPVAVVPPAAAPTNPPLAAPEIRELRFYRSRDGVAESVESGAAVRLGDELWVRVACGDSAHVYVLNEDDRGAVFALFPVAGTDLRNPLPPGRAFELPGVHGGESMHWQISTPAARERFLVVAARRPLAALEAQIAALAPAAADAPLAYAEVDEPLLATLRGAGRLKRASPARLHESRLEALTAALEGADGVWLREVEFVHAR